MNDVRMRHQDITEQILGCCFTVMNELGSGFLESVYEKALIIVLREQGLSVINQKPMEVNFRGQVIGNFFADLLVEKKVIVELKAVKMLKKEHQGQVINYLKVTGIGVGLLVNFGRPRIEYRRLFTNS